MALPRRWDAFALALPENFDHVGVFRQSQVYNGPMLAFGAPYWLLFPALLAAGGAWALFRTGRLTRPVSSLRLWREAQAAQPSRRGRLDPLLLLIFLAGLFAGTALALPRWQQAPPARVPPPAPDLVLSVRTLASASPARTEAFVQSSAPASLLRVRLDPDPNTPPVEMPLPRGALARGATVELPQLPGTLSTLDLELLSGTTLIAQRRFHRPAARVADFALDEYGSADPALRRFFEIQPAAHREDPTLPVHVVLVNQRGVLAQLAGQEGATFPLAGEHVLLIVQAAELPPGIAQAGPERLAPPAAPAGGWPATVFDAGAWPSFVSLRDVKIRSLRPVTCSPAWQVLATAGDPAGDAHPWLAQRQFESGRVTALWLASDPTRDSNWPDLVSFALFWAEMQHRASGAAATPPAYDWTPLPDPAGIPAGPTDLQRPLGMAALGFLVLAAGLFLWQRRS